LPLSGIQPLGWAYRKDMTASPSSRPARVMVVCTAALASTAIAAPYVKWLGLLRDDEQQRLLASVVVTGTTALLTGALTWLATLARSPSRAAWLCALAPVLGALNAGLSLGVVTAATEAPALARFVESFVVGSVFGVPFGAPMGAAFGVVLAALVYRFVLIREHRSHDGLDRVAQWCGVWLAASTLLAMSFTASVGGPRAFGYPAAAAAVLLFGGGVARTRARRRWLARVRAGAVPGWRIVDVRERGYDVELPLFDSRQPLSDGVLVRVSSDIPTYRAAPEREMGVARVGRCPEG
jgi:hypothetical protein